MILLNLGGGLSTLRALVFLVCLARLSGLGSGSGAVVFPEAGLPSPNLRHIPAAGITLSATAPQDISADFEVVGYSVEGREIRAYRFGRGPHPVGLIGGIHGGYERNTILLAYEIILYFSAHPHVVPDPLSVYIVPSANPDGLYRLTAGDARMSLADVSSETAPGRFNANGVDLNRNWDCDWSPFAVWRDLPISAGSRPFSEVESQVLRDFLLGKKMQAVVFWHSALPGVFPGHCGETLPLARTLVREYARASGYPAKDEFSGYPVTGDAADWLALVGIPAFEVELSDHRSTEFDKNLAGVLAVLSRLGYLDSNLGSNSPR